MIARIPMGRLGQPEETAQAVLFLIAYSDYTIVATGARLRVLRGIEPDRQLIWTYYDAMVPECVPKSLLIKGSGAIGMELASFSRTMGAEVGRFPFAANGKAIALGKPEGMVKAIFDKNTGQLLDPHMVGAEVTELIQGYVVAMNLKATADNLIPTVFSASEVVRNDAREHAGCEWARDPPVTSALGRS